MVADNWIYIIAALPVSFIVWYAFRKQLISAGASPKRVSIMTLTLVSISFVGITAMVLLRNLDIPDIVGIATITLAVLLGLIVGVPRDKLPESISLLLAASSMLAFRTPIYEVAERAGPVGQGLIPLFFYGITAVLWDCCRSLLFEKR